ARLPIETGSGPSQPGRFLVSTPAGRRPNRVPVCPRRPQATGSRRPPQRGIPENAGDNTQQPGYAPAATKNARGGRSGVPRGAGAAETAGRGQSENPLSAPRAGRHPQQPGQSPAKSEPT